MKNIIYSVLTICILVLFGSSTYAQQGKVKMQAKEKVKQVEQDAKNTTLDDKSGKSAKSNNKGKTSDGGVKGQAGQGKTNVGDVIGGKDSGKTPSRKGKVIDAGDKIIKAKDKVDKANDRAPGQAPKTEPKTQPKPRSRSTTGSQDKAAPAATTVDDETPTYEEVVDEGPYWDNPNGLEGKEFGQEKARQAKLHQDLKRKELDETISQAERKIGQATERIGAVTKELEEAKKKRKISNANYDIKKAQIQKAGVGLKDLEQKVINAKKGL